MLAAFLLFPGFFVLAIVFSFLPTILAASRHHQRAGRFSGEFFSWLDGDRMGNRAGVGAIAASSIRRARRVRSNRGAAVPEMRSTVRARRPILLALRRKRLAPRSR